MILGDLPYVNAHSSTYEKLVPFYFLREDFLGCVKPIERSEGSDRLKAVASNVVD